MTRQRPKPRQEAMTVRNPTSSQRSAAPSPRKPSRAASEPERAAKAAMAHEAQGHPSGGMRGEAHPDRLTEPRASRMVHRRLL